MASARPGLSRFLKKVEESFHIIVVTRLALEPAEVVLAKAGVLEDIFAIINIDFNPVESIQSILLIKTTNTESRSVLLTV